MEEFKFCAECGEKIAKNAVICPKCGCQAGGAAAAQPQIVINNQNVNGAPAGQAKNKWVALIIWWFFGYIGGHKFYEGKIGMGILYFLTFGLFGIGYVIDFWALLFKSNPYYV